jgi:hypothetical protein
MHLLAMFDCITVMQDNPTIADYFPLGVEVMHVDFVAPISELSGTV